ncbi:hypothetical protein J6Y73_03995 [bacterium]|nr:hypothetical protein [bacterium]
MIVNPIFNSVKSQAENTKSIKKDIDFSRLYLSFVFMISFIILMLIKRDNFSDTLSIILVSTSLFISILILIFLSHYHKKPLIFILIYEISFAAFLAFSSFLLKDKLGIINNAFNPNSSIFITLSVTTVLSTVIHSIISVFFRIRHFYLELSILLVLDSIFIILYSFIYNHYDPSISIFINSITGIITSALLNFGFILYREEIRKLDEVGIDKKDTFILAFIHQTLIFYLPIELVFLFTKKH